MPSVFDLLRCVARTREDEQPVRIARGGTEERGCLGSGYLELIQSECHMRELPAEIEVSWLDLKRGAGVGDRPQRDTANVPIRARAPRASMLSGSLRTTCMNSRRASS